MSIEDLERKNGFRRYPSSREIRPLGLLAFLVFTVWGLLFLGLFFLIPVALFLAGCRYNTQIGRQIEQLQKLRLAASPPVIASPLLAGAQRVTFFGKNKIAVAVDSFMVPNSPATDWFSSMALSLDREIQAVLTTGGPPAHDRRRPQLYRIIMAELKERESAQEVADAMKRSIEDFGITALPVDAALFAATAGHNCWYAHGYASYLRMDMPLPALLKPVRDSLDFERHEDLANYDCTAIVSVRPGPLHESGKTIEVGLDLVMFAPGRAWLSLCEKHFLKRPRLKMNPSKMLYSNANIKVIRRGKLKIGAAFVVPPLNPMHMFLCIPPAPRLSSEDPDELSMLKNEPN